MVTVKKVETQADRREFVNFPDRLYKANPYYVPELKADALDYINPKKNPSWKLYDAQCFLAVRDGKTVGRIMAILNDESNRIHGGDFVRFGAVDFVDDKEVSAALLAAVEQWGRQRGKTQIHGPLGFTDADPEGMLVEGFDEQDMSITIYNAPYYSQHLEALGYAKDIDWVEYLVSVPGPDVIEKLNRLSGMIEERFGYRVQHFKNARAIMPVAREYVELMMEAYKDLYGYVAMSDEQVSALVDKFFPLLNPAFVKIIYDADGRMIAGGVAVPSLAKALQKSGGRLFPLGWARLLHALRVNDRLELLLVAVKKEHQNRGVTALLLNAMVKEAAQRGYRYAETGPELETNEKVMAMWKPFQRRQHRRRRVYAKDIM
ncbi:MAG: GNAT family N-acetyltransferase [Eubacteriales bacterium]|nr:GNAT family N-acetyltransferase [Eubacteriales bacterium]